MERPRAGSYIAFVLEQVLRSKGARKIVVVGVGPLGCIPAVRALHPAQECFERGTQIAIDHNMALDRAGKHWASRHPDLTLVTTEFFNFMTERQNNPKAYGTNRPSNLEEMSFDRCLPEIHAVRFLTTFS